MTTSKSFSKSFLAVLPILSDEELQRLRAWSEENCAAASIFREDDCVIWLASKERARSREAFMRFCRSTLQRLAIRAKPRGRWLILANETSVRSEAARCAPAPMVRPEQPSDVVVLVEGDIDRITKLSGSGQLAPPIEVVQSLASAVCGETGEGGHEAEDRIVFGGGDGSTRRSGEGLQVFKEG
jgi:hypothetical protein